MLPGSLRFLITSERKRGACPGGLLRGAHISQGFLFLFGSKLPVCSKTLMEQVRSVLWYFRLTFWAPFTAVVAAHVSTAEIS